MYEYTIEQAVDAYQSKDKSQHDIIWDDMLSSGVGVENEVIVYSKNNCIYCTKPRLC